MLVVVLSALTPFGSWAQDRQILKESICDSCSLLLEHRATIEGPELEGEPMAILLQRDRRLLMSFFPAGDVIRAFDLAGEAPGVFAQRGQGPGEVSYVTRLQALPGDSLLAFEAGNGRASVFDPNGRHVRTFRVQGRVLDSAPIGAGGFLVNGMMANAPTEPLHVLAEDGTVTASMGARAEAPLPAREPALSLRRVTSDLGGRLWSAMPTSYEIRQWDQAGELSRWLVRDVEWFKPYFTSRVLEPEAEFPAWLIDLHWLDVDRVAVIVHVAAENWRRYLGAPVTTSSGRVVYPYLVVDKVHETLVEIIDVQAAEVLWSQRLPGYAVGFADSRHIVFYREDVFGAPSLDLFRVEFQVGAR